MIRWLRVGSRGVHVRNFMTEKFCSERTKWALHPRLKVNGVARDLLRDFSLLIIRGVTNKIMKWLELFFAYFVTFAVSWSLFRTYLLRRRTKGFPYVPGPRGGSIFAFRLLRGQRPGSFIWKTLYDMRRAHGACYCMMSTHQCSHQILRWNHRRYHWLRSLWPPNDCSQ